MTNGAAAGRLEGSKWPGRSKWMRRLLPGRIPEYPEAPEHWEGMIVQTVRVELSLADRVRVLLTGKLKVDSRIATEKDPGGTRSASVTAAGVH